MRDYFSLELVQFRASSHILQIVDCDSAVSVQSKENFNG